MPKDSFSSSFSKPAGAGGGSGASVDKHVSWATESKASGAAEAFDDIPDDLIQPQAAPYVEHFDRAPVDADAAAAAAQAFVEEEEAAAGNNAWEAILQDEFLRKDKNGDGFLSMKEISLKELLELDVDHNGFISVEEFFNVFIQKTARAFLTTDLDGDGRLSLREFAKGDPTPAQEAAYERFARRPDLGLTIEEFRNYLADSRGKK